MQTNPQNPIIICYASKELVVQDKGGQYLVITDKGGQKHKISEKRQALWALFNNARDAEPFMLVYETYNNIQYVADARPITDDLLKLAIQDLGLKLADQQTVEKVRSQSVAYAKDLVCASRCEPDAMFALANKIYDFIRGAQVNKVELEK